MIPQKKNSTSDYTAKYLVLLADEHATRALLFAQDNRFLAEVIDDDGLLLEDLMKCGTACPPPGDVARLAWASAPSSVQCFALDERRCNE